MHTYCKFVGLSHDCVLEDKHGRSKHCLWSVYNGSEMSVFLFCCHQLLLNFDSDNYSIKY